MLYNLAIVICLIKRHISVSLQFGWLVGLFGKNGTTDFFKQKELSIGVLLDKVKTLVWWWLKTKKKSFNYNLNMW
jgi:hypothetical protein